MSSSKRRWKRLIKAIGPLLLIFLLIRIVDPMAVADRLAELRPGIFLVSILFFPLAIALRTLRWWLICQYLNMRVSFQSLFPILYISRFLSIIPITGFFALSKIIYLKDEDKPAGTTGVSILLNKAFDILGLLFFGLFAFVYFPGILIKDSPIWVLYCALILLLGLLIIFGKKLGNGLWALFKRHLNQKSRSIGANIEADLTRFWSVFSLKLFFLFLVLAIVIGLLRSLVLYVLAISINIHVPFAMIVACRALIGIVNVIPVSIGGLGTREAVLLLTLPLAGISDDGALALGLVAFIWNILFRLSGVVFWMKRPLPTKAIRAVHETLFPSNGRS